MKDTDRRRKLSLSEKLIIEDYVVILLIVMVLIAIGLLVIEHFFGCKLTLPFFN